MRKVLVGVTAVLLVLAMTLAFMELVLRVMPSLISVAVLERMHPSLRSEIAGQLGLPTAGEYVVIESAQRSDGGPDLFISKPNQSWSRPVDDADRSHGAIDTYTMDGRGFCNPPELASLPFVDVVTVAGSVPNCSSVDAERVFSAQLGDVLSTSSYNLAVPGVGPYEYNEVLSRYVDDLRPRVVIFAISEANDLRDIQRYLDHVAGEGRERKGKLGGPFRYSYVLAFIKAGIEALVRQASASSRPNFRYSVNSGGERIAMNIGNGDGDELRSAQDLLAGKLSPDLYEAPLRRFVDLSKQYNFVPVVIYVPAAYTVYQPGIAFEDPSISEAMAAYNKIQSDWLADEAASIGYRFVDATSALQAKGAEAPLLYFPSDMHLTAAGHRALAEAVQGEVRSALDQIQRSP